MSEKKRLDFWRVSLTLAIFAAVTFTLDMLLGVLFPNWWVMQGLWELLLPGFVFISWGSFWLGLAESFIGGFLTAVLFVGIYNILAGYLPSRATTSRKIGDEPVSAGSSR